MSILFHMGAGLAPSSISGVTRLIRNVMPPYESVSQP